MKYSLFFVAALFLNSTSPALAGIFTLNCAVISSAHIVDRTSPLYEINSVVAELAAESPVFTFGYSKRSSTKILIESLQTEPVKISSAPSQNTESQSQIYYAMVHTSKSASDTSIANWKLIEFTHSKEFGDSFAVTAEVQLSCK